MRFLFVLAIAGGVGCMHSPPSGALAPAGFPAAIDAFVFQADPTVIEPGQSSILRWSAPGASEVLIEEAVGENQLRPLGTFSSSGALRVNPQEDATHVISCQGNADVSCASVLVRVRIKTP